MTPNKSPKPLASPLSPMRSVAADHSPFSFLRILRVLWAKVFSVFESLAEFLSPSSVRFEISNLQFQISDPVPLPFSRISRISRFKLFSCLFHHPA
jgi:hypothetical protein